MQEFKEALNRGEAASEEMLPIANKSSVFRYLSCGVGGASLSQSVSSIDVSQRGVDFVVSCDDSQAIFEQLSSEDSLIEVFGDLYKVRKRGGSVVIYSELDTDVKNEHSLKVKMDEFLISATSGSGISFVGSPNLSLTVRLVDLIANHLPDASCNVYFDGAQYVMSEYDIKTNKVVNKTTKASINELLLSVEMSPYKYVFIESYSGIDIIPEAVNLAISGKRIIYAKNSISSVYAIYSAMQAIDTQVLSPLFAGALFVDNLAFVKGAVLPKIEFMEHQSFAKWGALKTSPLRDELILIDPQCGLLDVSKREMVLTEVIIPSKAVSKWISEKVNPLDFAGNLRLDQGWISIADEAAIAVRDEAVTFDQVLRKISLI